MVECAAAVASGMMCRLKGLPDICAILSAISNTEYVAMPARVANTRTVGNVPGFLSRQHARPPGAEVNGAAQVPHVTFMGGMLNSTL